jgi:myo-inositol-1(or 4)-monophosphatase
MAVTHEELENYVAIAHELADAAGAVILPYFRGRLALDNKAGPGGFDPVTAADRGAEEAMRSLLGARLPDHGIEGEEYGAKAPDADFRWVIDPIDGTRAFIVGLPTWGTLIGLLDRGAPVLGMMNQPYSRERFWSSQDASYFRAPEGGTQRLSTRACPELATAMLSTTDPGMFKPGLEETGFSRIKERVRAVRYGADCYAYCLLAAGHIDIVVEAGLKPYDIVALIPIIERAGGRVTTWEGEPATGGGRIVATGDPRLHEAALELLK